MFPSLLLETGGGGISQASSLRRPRGQQTSSMRLTPRETARNNDQAFYECTSLCTCQTINRTLTSRVSSLTFTTGNADCSNTPIDGIPFSLIAECLPLPFP